MLCDLHDSTKLMTLSPKDGKCGMCMSMRSCGSLLFVGYESGSVIVWDVNNGTEVSHANIHNDSLMGLDYDPVLQKGCSVSVDNVIKVWKLPEGDLKVIDEVTVVNEGFSSVRFRGDSKLYATGGWDGQARVFSGKKHTPLAVLSYHQQSIQTLTFSSQLTLYLGSKDGNISSWRIYTNT